MENIRKQILLIKTLLAKGKSDSFIAKASGATVDAIKVLKLSPGFLAVPAPEGGEAE
jgi:hypothetical protein